MNRREFLVIAVTVFLTIVAWVMFEVYRIQVATPTNSEIEAIPLDFKLDTTIFQQLEERTI